MEPMLVLMGMRGSGKTSVGRILADALDRPLIDLDDAVLHAFPETSVRAAWAAHGEAAWREAETKALAAVLHAENPRVVLALGGGTPTAPGAPALLRRAASEGRAWTLLLEAEPEVLARRLRASEGDRPSLTGAPVAEEIERVWRARRAIYRSLADAVVDAGRDEPRRVAEDALRAWRRRRPRGDAGG